MQAPHVFALAASALFLKMFAIAIVQAMYRLRHKQFTKAEDAAKWGDGTVYESEHPVAERGQRALRNDLENIPLFLFIALGYIMVGGPRQPFAIYAAVFVAARVVHTVAYLRPTQPLRNRAYLVGVLASMVMIGHIVYEIITA